MSKTGLDQVQFRDGMTGRQVTRTLEVYQRELGPGFGWACFVAGVTIPEARRLHDADPDAINKLACLFDGLWESDHAK